MYAYSLLLYVSLMTLALVNAVCPSGWEAYRGVCYLFVQDEFVTWQDANSYCGLFGGQLAELMERDRDRWVAQRAMQLHRAEWWIGLNDLESENKWIWAGSRSVGSFFHTNWQSGEPNGRRSSNCAGLNASGNWNDDSCRSRRRFICERSESQRPYRSSRRGRGRGRLARLTDIDIHTDIHSHPVGSFDSSISAFDSSVGTFGTPVGAFDTSTGFGRPTSGFDTSVGFAQPRLGF